MGLGIKNVIRANHMISLITSLTTDPITLTLFHVITETINNNICRQFAGLSVDYNYCQT